MRHILLLIVFVVAACSPRVSAPENSTRLEKQQTDTDAVSLVPETGPESCSLCVKSNPLLVVDKEGVATGDLNLCNEGTDPIPLALALSDFSMVRPKLSDAPMSTLHTLAGADGKQIPDETQLARGKCLTIRMQVSKFGQGGLATAHLSNAGKNLIEVKAIRYDVPFNLKVDGPTPEKLDLSFTRGKPAKIRLRNEDGMGYRFRWLLELGDERRQNWDIVDPKGRVELEVQLDDDEFSFLESGFLRSGLLSGQLILDYEPDAGFRAFPKPQKVYPATARLNYHGETGQRFWTAFLVLAVLLLGILLFLVINFVLPMQSARVDVKQRLADLDGKLAGLSETVDSRLLSLLRIEKKRLREELRTLLPLFPQTQIELPKLGTRVDQVATRIDLTVQAGELLDSLRTDAEFVSVHEAEEVRAHCREVFAVASKPLSSDEEVKAARGFLQKATQIIDEADGKPSTERLASLRETQTNVEALIKQYQIGISGWQLPEWSKEVPPFEGALLTSEMVKGCELNFPQSAAAQPDRVNYIRHAKAVGSARLLMEFARLVETAGGSKVRDSRLKRLPDLLAALRPGSGESIVQAAEIVRQVEQNVSRPQIEEAIANATPDVDMWIEKDPPTPLVLQLVTFRVRFKEPGLDAAAARKEIKCTWTIAGEPQEGLTGWMAGSFFEERPGWFRHPIKKWRLYKKEKKSSAILYPFPVEASFSAPARKLSTRIKVERSKSYVESRTILALVGLLVTVLVVGFGLLAAAQEKLQTLDWMSGFLAILVLGYTANAVKNLITKT